MDNKLVIYAMAVVGIQTTVTWIVNHIWSFL